MIATKLDEKGRLQTMRFYFNPLPDITIYELARIIPIITGQMILQFPDDWERMPKDVQRHFSQTKPD